MRRKTAPGALVTGAAQGIGRAVAALLASRGYQVAVADVKAPSGPLAPGIFYVRADVSSEASVRAAVHGAMKRLPRLDALVNNAGIASPGNGPVEKLSLREWNRRIGVNLTGAFLMAKHCAPHLRRTRGAMVNIASI